MVVVWVALIIYVTGLVLTFGVRTVRQLRRTGRSGWVGVSRGTGPAARWGAAAFGGSLLLGLTGLVIAVAGVVPGPQLHSWVGWVGAAAAVAGIGVVVASQAAMGDAWRIGVDPDERTGLVTSGTFRWARNPIFSGMVLGQAGVVLMVPSWPMWLSLLLLICGVLVQVRAVEEPYLARIHGAPYSEYAARVGRFLPGIGCSRSGAE